jgi:hypothetical protein
VSPIDISKGSGGQFSLGNSTKVWTQFWISMQLQGWRSAMKKFPSSLRVRVTYPHGKASSLAGLISNPRFCELIMGWPIDWTAPGARVTAFPAWLRRSRGQFSRLLMTFQAEPEA